VRPAESGRRRAKETTDGRRVVSNPTIGGTGIVVSRKRPGHFVALTEDGRVDAMLQGSVKIATRWRSAPLSASTMPSRAQ